MCDPGLILGLAAGAASVGGQAATAAKNTEMVRQQTALEYAQQDREFIVETNAANKEAYSASLEADRGKAFVAAKGAGMRGSTAGARIAEQARQGALSIANARDRSDAAKSNYKSAGKATQIGAQNRVNAMQVNPLSAFTQVATAGISNYGAFG